jgi:type I restriction enzyme M protein
MSPSNHSNKSLESWIWDAACAIRGAQDAPKYKDFILPLIFVKRLCDVFDDELERVTKSVGTKEKALKLIAKDRKLTRFFIPFIPANIDEPTWSAIRNLSAKIGEQLTDLVRSIARENPRLQGIIDRVDFNATTHGQRDIDDDRLSNLIEEISKKRLGLKDVEPDIIGRSYEYLIRKFAEGSGSSAGEFYTPMEVGMIMARILDPEPGMEVYDPCCGSAGLLIKCQLVLEGKMQLRSKKKFAPLKLYGQEYIANTWAMANMNMVIHDMEGIIEIGDTMNTPKFREKNKLQKFDIVTANPMWNQSAFNQKTYENDELERFSAGLPPNGTADWGWVQHMLASMNEPANGGGKAAIVLDTGAVARGSGNQSTNREKEIRKWFVDNDLIEGVLYLPENLFYNTSAPGIVLFLNNNKPTGKKNKILLINASKEFIKGQPKNYIPEENQDKIVITFLNWKEVEKFSKIIIKDEAVKNDYNLSPTRYIHTEEEETYRPIGEILEELKELEQESKDIDKELKNIFQKLGY